MSNPLTGAALHARILQQVREELAPWGLPLNLYDTKVEQDGQWFGPYSEGSGRAYWEPLPTHTVTFKHRLTGAEIVVTQIYTDDEGNITQFGTQDGALTL